MIPELISGVIGGVIGGILGVVGTLVGAYYGPRKLEEWREKRADERLHGPRKRLLKKLLEDGRFPDGRTLETLTLHTGTMPDECRRLLIEIEARGVKLKDDKEGWKEGWALISRKPLLDTNI